MLREDVDRSCMNILNGVGTDGKVVACCHSAKCPSCQGSLGDYWVLVHLLRWQKLLGTTAYLARRTMARSRILLPSSCLYIAHPNQRRTYLNSHTPAGSLDRQVKNFTIAPSILVGASARLPKSVCTLRIALAMAPKVCSIFVELGLCTGSTCSASPSQLQVHIDKAS